MRRTLSLFAVTALTAATLVACGGSGDRIPDPVPIGDTVALSGLSTRVFTFNKNAPGTLVSDRAISGLNSGETLLGIDVRPANGLVYTVTSAGRILTLDPATGLTTFRANLVADTTDTTSPFTALAGTNFGLDFNPVPDRLRLISNTGQNLRINVDTGATITDGTINSVTTGAPGATITAAAYTNSFAGTTTTQLFTLDGTSGQRFLQNPPNDGTQAGGSPLGAAFSAVNGFDIDGRNNMGFAAATVNGSTRLYRVPVTGAATATDLGVIGNGQAITGLALLQPANPQVYVLTGNSLARMALATPNSLTGTVAISGLNPGENVVGVDFRPANGNLYALTSAGRILVVNPDTGVSTAPVTLFNSTTNTVAFTALAGTSFSVDFNPVPDRMRVISNTGQSLRINVATGETIVDGSINPAPAVVTGAAYSNSFAGTATTTLYDVEALSSTLAIQNPPNNGTLVPVGALGSLGVAVAGSSSIDIAGGDNGLVLGAFRVGATGPYSLYNVNLTTGVAALRGAAAAAQIGGASGPAITDIAIRY